MTDYHCCVEYLGVVVEKNPSTFRIFSPDGMCTVAYSFLAADGWIVL
jgi:phosphoketolase